MTKSICWWPNYNNLSKLYSWLHLTYTTNCLFDSHAPTHRRPVANQLPTNRNVFPISWQSIAHLSPTDRRLVADFKDSCRRPVADWSATEKRSFWSHSGCIGCSCFSVARQSPTGCSTCVTGALGERTLQTPSNDAINSSSCYPTFWKLCSAVIIFQPAA